MHLFLIAIVKGCSRGVCNEIRPSILLLIGLRTNLIPKEHEICNKYFICKAARCKVTKRAVQPSLDLSRTPFCNYMHGIVYSSKGQGPFQHLALSKSNAHAGLNILLQGRATLALGIADNTADHRDRDQSFRCRVSRIAVTRLAVCPVLHKFPANRNPFML